MKTLIVGYITVAVVAAACFGFTLGRACGAEFGHTVTPLTCKHKGE